MTNFSWSSQLTRRSRQDLLVIGQLVPVDDQELVLVELDLLGDVGVEHGQAGTPVVEEQFLIFPQDALEHGRVDVLPVQVGVSSPVAAVAGLEDHVDDATPAGRAGP